MNFLSKLVGYFRGPASALNPSDFANSGLTINVADMDTQPLRPEGGTVTPVTAASVRTVPAAHACVSILSETLARLPWLVVDKAQPTVERPMRFVNGLLEDPARDVDGFTFWNGVLRDLFVDGNSYVAIVRVGGTPRELIHGTLSEMRREAGEWRYRLDVPHATTSGTVTTNLLDSSDVIHLRWSQYNPRTGRSESPIRAAARTSLGLHESINRYQKGILDKGVHSNMVIGGDTALIAQLGATEYAKLNKAVQKAQGLNEAGKPFVLPAGFTAREIGFSSVDLQLLEVAKFTVEDIARVYGVPLFLLQVNQGKATEPQGSNLQEQFTAFQRTSLSNHVARITSELTRKLLSTEQRRSLRIHIPTERVSMGTMEDVVGIVDIAVQKGAFLTVNEGRHLFGYPPISGGDELRQPTGAPAQETSDETV